MRALQITGIIIPESADAAKKVEPKLFLDVLKLEIRYKTKTTNMRRINTLKKTVYTLIIIESLPCVSSPLFFPVNQQVSRLKTMKRLLLFDILLSFILFTDSSCPNLENLRTDFIVNSFDVQQVSGFWYEIAYKDIAQIGETCQYYNKTVISNGVDISEHFGFTYTQARHTNLLYSSTSNAGVYTKALSRPARMSAIEALRIGKGIPTVVVDVTVNTDGSYETLTEYACYEMGPVTYEEIRLGARTPTVSSATLLSMENVLRDQGVDFKHLRTVDQSANCTYK